MNKAIEEFKYNIKEKSVAVIGIGVSNTPLVKLLVSNGAIVTAFDKKEKNQIGENYKILEDLGCRFSLGQDYLSKLHNFEYIFRTPGMRYDISELLKAQEHGAIVTSEIELFLKLCPCQVFGVTGSDGKTTTTTLIYLILKDAGYNCWLGGNIGIPLIEKVEKMNKDDKVILELSSFQLHTLAQSPNISIITNISPNHLDYHKSMQEYIDAKKNIIKYQKNNDKVILNYDNETTKTLTSECIGNVEFFSRVNRIEKGIMIKDSKIVKKDNTSETEIMDIDDILLPGTHNVENYLAAIAATIDYVKPKNIKNVADSFGGVEHRIEFVCEIDGIKFYNDSIGTSPTRTTASINAFEQKVILIAGGYDKNIPFDSFGEVVVNKTKHLFLIGKTADKIETAVHTVDSDFPVIKCDSLKEAVEKSYSIAKSGDIVILSPACASFDMYSNFEERGEHFKRLVCSLKN